MSNPAIPDLLEELRDQNGPVDWRRSHPNSRAGEWGQRLSALEGKVPKKYYLEAQALLAKFNVDLVGMVDALCALAKDSRWRADFVRKEIWSIFNKWEYIYNKWEYIDRHSNQEEKQSLLIRFEENLIDLLKLYPGDRIFIFAFSVVLRQRRGVSDALDFLEREATAGSRVADLYLIKLMEHLGKRGDPEILARALRVSQVIEDGAGEVWHPFIIYRAFILASLIHHHGMNIEILPFEPNLLRALSDFNAALTQTLKALDDLKPVTSARILLSISKVRAFWRSPVPGSEEARLQAINYVFKKIRASHDDKERELLFRALFSMLPQTIKFWTDKQWRLSVSKDVIEQCAEIREPYLSLIRSRFFFAQENYAATRICFADLAKFAPNKNGPSTYVDPWSVAEKLSAPPSVGKFPECTSHFELIHDVDRGSEPVIISSANDRYFFRYGEYYVRRLSTFAPIGHVHFHLFADHDSIRDSVCRLSDLIPNFRFTWSCEPVTVNEPYFFATGRFLRVPKWLEQFNAPIVVTDIDSLWDRAQSDRPSDFINDRLGSADVALNLRSRVHIRTMVGMPVPGLYYPSVDPWTAVLAGVMVLGATEGARQFAEILSSLTHHELSLASKRSSRGNWGIDQNILCATYAYVVKNCPQIKLADIHATEVGWGQHWLAEKDTNTAIF